MWEDFQDAVFVFLKRDSPPVTVKLVALRHGTDAAAVDLHPSVRRTL